ncbi:MAG: cupin domain-containing protein [Candidatus Limnocylindrales bacterium]|jgi:uncharacterized RmlC-like cupin family protein
MRIIRPIDQERSSRGAFSRGVAISRNTGAQNLWVAYAEMAPGAVSGAHHHGPAETAIFIVDGSARFFVGPDQSEALDAETGDFVWVEPGEVHVEMNRSPAEPLRMVVVRTPDDIAVDAPYSRAALPGDHSS